MKFRLSIRGKKDKGSIDATPALTEQDEESPRDNGYSHDPDQAPVSPRELPSALPSPGGENPRHHHYSREKERERSSTRKHDLKPLFPMDVGYAPPRPMNPMARSPMPEHDMFPGYRSQPHPQPQPPVPNGHPSPLEEPVLKVAPAVFRKYGLQGDWRDHVMVLTYGPPDKRTERYLGLDEQPLLQFNGLKEAGQNPAFSFVKLAGIQSPVSIATRKNAARRASGHTPIARRKGSEPHVHHSQPTLDDISKRSQKTRSGDASSIGSGTAVSSSKSARLSGTTLNTFPTRDSWSSKHPSEHGSANSHHSHGGPSYAVAIYPWLADYEDEFDAEVGDAFVVISRSPQWWTCQRDESGTGVFDETKNRTGWVPSGSLLELNIPISVALTEARKHFKNRTSFKESRPLTRMPILPQHIMTAYYFNVGLADFWAREEEEIDLKKDEVVKVYKKYNQWCYIVKDDGERGWVPKWLLGKNPVP